MVVNEANVELALKQFGLSNVEVSVYKAGLQMGSRPASVIAEKAGIKRSQTYNVLSVLSKKGIVQEVEKNSVRHFSFSPPESLLSILESREAELAAQKDQIQQIIPYLQQLCANSPSKPKVRFYRGFDGIKEVFTDMLTTKDSEIFGAIDLKNSLTVENRYEEKWIQRHIAERDERNISWRGFAVESEAREIAYANRPSKLRRTKLLQGVELWAEIQIYDHKVAVTSTHREKLGIILESEPIANTLRTLFELLWSTAAW